MKPRAKIAASMFSKAEARKEGEEYGPFWRAMEGWEGKVEGEESRVMMVMLKLEEEERREVRIWEPIVPLAFWWWVG